MESLLNKLASKHAMRTELRSIRKGIDPLRRQQATDALLLHLLPALVSTDYVLSFASFDHEIDTSLVNLYLARTRRLLLPTISGQNLRIFRVTNLETELQNHVLGIPQPNPFLCEEVDPRLIEIALIPAIGFDQANHRLGYGYGFYDRFLKHLPDVHTIGIGFKEQFVSSIPTEPGDVALAKVSLF